MYQTLRYHIDNRAYRFEINNIQYSLVILVQWRSIVKERNLMRLRLIKPCHIDGAFICF
ncbi:hypothetical protein SAMN03159284_02411 [Mucilaginibacter sp. NFR10]|nr:hypothetical protein SAMN03159284_02411 [Mucilaginibacter sp. NFR10]